MARVAEDDVGDDERFAGRREGDLDGVVHAAAADALGVGAVGAAAVDGGGAALEGEAVGLADVVSVAAVAEVEQTVGAELRSVQVGRIAG